MAGKYVCHKLIPQHRNTHAIMAFIVPIPPEKLDVVTFHVCCCSCALLVKKEIFAATSVTGTDARCRDGTSPTSCIGWFGTISIIINIDLVGNTFVRVFFILFTLVFQFHDRLPSALRGVDREYVGLHLRLWQSLHPLLHGNCPGICHDSSGVGTDDDAIVDGVDGLNADDQVGNLVILNLFLALLLSSFSDMGGGKSDMKEIIANLFSKTNTNSYHATSNNHATSNTLEW